MHSGLKQILHGYYSHDFLPANRARIMRRSAPSLFLVIVPVL
jgi:hypothetical protein